MPSSDKDKYLGALGLGSVAVGMPALGERAAAAFGTPMLDRLGAATSKELSVTKQLIKDLKRSGVGVEIEDYAPTFYDPIDNVVVTAKNTVPEFIAHEYGHAVTVGKLPKAVNALMRIGGKGIAAAAPIASFFVAASELPKERKNELLDTASLVAAGAYGTGVLVPEAVASMVGAAKILQHGGPKFRSAFNLSRAFLTYAVTGAAMAGAPQVMKYMNNKKQGSLLKEALLFKDPNEGLKLGLTLAAGGGLGYLLRALIGDGKKKNEMTKQLQTVISTPQQLVDAIKNESVMEQIKEAL